MAKPLGVEIFDRIAKHYEFTSKFLSFGVLPYWLKRLEATVEGGEIVLDLACGTGVLFPKLSKKFKKVVGLDYSLPMLEVAKGKSCPNCFTVRGDALRLPFKSESFSSVVVSLGLRHFSDIDDALREITRVLKPGGTLRVLEVGIPENAFLRRLFLTFLKRVVLPLGRLRAKEEVYDHLFGSIIRFPHENEFLKKLNSLGYEELEYEPVMFGVAYIYKGRKVKERG
jgi:demethylmenaquinone methyltransferase/2-methoxy-6-polyprenyl-1,4-benzoquinol methylase